MESQKLDEASSSQNVDQLGQRSAAGRPGWAPFLFECGWQYCDANEPVGTRADGWSEEYSGRSARGERIYRW